MELKNRDFVESIEDIAYFFVEMGIFVDDDVKYNKVEVLDSVYNLASVIEEINELVEGVV